MKKILCFLFAASILIFSSNSNAQQVIASAGGYYEGNGISLSWTLGEPVIETFEGNGIILTQGFQQPYSFYLSQILNIPAGWSGISGYIDPMNKGVDNMFSTHIPDFVILASLSGFYYPDGGTNTIGDWDYETGYKVKAGSAFDVTLTGTKISPPEVSLFTGWNLMPVLTSCGCPTEEVFDPMDQLEIVKEVAGPNIYWPQYGISSLENLAAGNAYMVLMNDNAGFTYPECTKSSTPAQPQEKPTNYSPWNNINYTASSHAIAFPAEVLSGSGIQPGDLIGVFTPEGLCAGRTEVAEISANKALVAFANDETTIGKDGFGFGEMLVFKVFRPSTNEEMELEIEYNSALPNMGIFADQGLSAAKNLKLQTSDVGELQALAIEVYPNPSNGVFNLTMSHWPPKMQVHIMDTKGRVIEIFSTGKKLDGSAFEFDFSHLPKGVYFLKLVDYGILEMKKIVIN